MVVYVVAEFAREGALGELLCADNLVLMSETIDGLRNKFIKWIEAFQCMGFKGKLGNAKVAAISLSHQSPSCGVSRFRSAQSITILLSLRSASKDSQNGDGCHEATVVAIVARCRVDSVLVLPKESAVTGAQMFQYSHRLPWQCLCGSINGRRSVGHQVVMMSCFQLQHQPHHGGCFRWPTCSWCC